MKNAAFRKLSGKRGASVLIALLIFFLAALSGTIVLTMATSNAGRYTHEKEDQQSYLSVISAANLILSKLEGVEVYFECDKSPQNESVTNEEINVTVRSSSDHSSKVEETMFLGDKNFQDNLKTFSRLTTDEIKSVSFTLSSSNASVSPTAEGASSDNHAEIGVVYVELTIEGTDLFFVLYYKDGEHFDYLLTLKVATRFDNEGGYNKHEKDENKPDDKVYFYKTMTFNTANATYTVGEFIEKTEKGEEKTEGEGGAGA